MRRFSAALLILFFLAATAAAPNPDDPSKKFLGAWRLVSIEGNPPGRPFVYDRPTGLIMYDASGHMCVNIVLKADRKPFAPYAKGIVSATTEEKAAAFETYAAYFGTFTIDAKAGTVTHHLEDNLVPGRQGTDNVRWFEFQGPDRLLLTPIEDGKGGVLARKDATYKLLWERLR
ncbi:MAG TPA: lipocalin-like domain-containing protein [Candidatus Acidoferrum sp.]|nr:lipocalin-like domain-containing protein [Candidatus Acidoferrum sp.]